MTDDEKNAAVIGLDQQAPPRIGPTARRKNAIWPILLGVMGILIAGIGTLVAFYTLMISLLPPSQIGFAEPGFDQIAPQYEQLLKDNSLALYVVGRVLKYGLVVVLWFFGIGLLCRSRWSITAGRIYGLGSLAALLIGVIMFVISYSDMLALLKSQQDFMPVLMTDKAILLISTISGFLWHLMIGVGTLAWLGSSWARSEWSNWS